MLHALTPLRPLLALLPARSSHSSKERAIAVHLPRDSREAADAYCSALDRADPHGGWSLVRVRAAVPGALTDGAGGEIVIESRGDELVATAFPRATHRPAYARGASGASTFVAIDADEIDVWDGDHSPTAPSGQPSPRIASGRLTWEDIAADHPGYMILDASRESGWLCIAWSDLD